MKNFLSFKSGVNFQLPKSYETMLDYITNAKNRVTELSSISLMSASY